MWDQIRAQREPTQQSLDLRIISPQKRTIKKARCVLTRAFAFLAVVPGGNLLSQMRTKTAQKRP
jgi:hypothetical protein